MDPLVCYKQYMLHYTVHYSRLTFVFLLSLVVLVTLGILNVWVFICPFHFDRFIPCSFWDGLGLCSWRRCFSYSAGGGGGRYAGLTRTNILTGIVPFSVHNPLSQACILDSKILRAWATSQKEILVNMCDGKDKAGAGRQSTTLRMQSITDRSTLSTFAPCD
jgi:hypothetical protein